MEEKKQSIINKRGFWIVLLSVLLFLPYAFLGPVTSESGDDMAMNLIASKAFGEQSQYLVYNNILYGYFLKFLYAILPGVNCYLAMQFFFNLSAIATICVCITKRMGNVQAFVCTVLLHFYFAFEYYEKTQFTQNAFLYALAAFILFADALREERRRKGVLILGSAFLVLAGMIRIKAMLMMLPFGILLLLALYRKDIKPLDFWKQNRAVWVALGAGLLLCLLNAGIDQLLFWRTEPWSSYNEYHQEGTVPFLDADTEEEPDLDYERIAADGIGLEDFYLLYNHQYLDRKHFSLEYLKKMGTYQGQGTESVGKRLAAMGQSAAELFALPKHYNGSFEGPGGIWTFLSLIESIAGWNLLLWGAVLVLLLRKKEKKGLLLRLGLILLLGIAEFSAFFILGYAPHRVLMGPRMAVELLCLYLPAGTGQSAEEEFGGKELRKGALTAALLFVCVAALRFSWHTAEVKDTETELVLEELRSLPSENYLLDGGLLWGNRLGIRDLRKLCPDHYRDYFSNFALSGGWVAECEHNLHYLRDKGLADPMALLADNEHLHYVVRSYRAELYVPWIGAYLEKKLGCKITAEAVYAGEELMVVDFARE